MQRTTRLKRPQVPEPGALIDFDDIVGRPKYAGEEMTSETDIPSVTAETEARQAADQEIWTEIETIEASSDVVDVVATYAELQQYDTSTLHDKDLIKVLQDETRQNAITYYRYSSSSETFSYVGAEGPYYTASETDTLLAAKQDTLIAGTNVQIAADGKTISATDTTYDDFVGATTLSNGEQGLVPAPLSTDANKFLQGDGSWGTPTDTTYTAGANVQISANNEISATDTTYSPFVGASSSVVGAAGLVPQPAIGDQNKYLKGDGTWATVQGGGSVTTFYLDGAPGVATGIFKDDLLQQSATEADLKNAFANGPVRVDDSGLYHYNIIVVDEGDGSSGSTRFMLVGKDGYKTYGFRCSSPLQWYIAEAQSKLTAGTNISISGSTISATDTTYTAGTGIAITNNQIKALSVINVTLDSPSAGYAVLRSGTTVLDTMNVHNYIDRFGADVILAVTGNNEYATLIGELPADADGIHYLFEYGHLVYDFAVGLNGTKYTVIDTQATMTGAAAGAAGTKGLVPAPASGDQGKFLKGDGTWATVSVATNNINSTDWNALWQ